MGYVEEKDYCAQVDNAILFLEGKNEQIMAQLTRQMQLASDARHYEQAAHYRDQIAQLRRLQKQQVVSVDSGYLV